MSHERVARARKPGLPIGPALACALALPLRCVASDYVFVDGYEPPVDCATPLACAAPPAGKTCVSGRLIAADSGRELRAFFHAELACGAGAIGGVCDLAVSAYDALAFIQNPGATPPLASSERILDGCGRFRFAGLDPPGNGAVAIAVDDDAAASDVHVETAAPHALAANQRVDGLDVVAARRETVMQWTQTAGAPFGAGTFADVGSLLLDFRASGVPRAGVSVTYNGGALPANDWYFADTSPDSRTTIAMSATSTGPNGSVLFASGALGTYSGTGGEPVGCTWPSTTAGSTPGVILYLRIDC